MLTATVEHWDPQGFGFARATNGRTFYFTVPGYVNGHFTGNMAKGRMIDIIEEQPTKGYPCPTAWKWNLLREAPVVVVAKQAVSPVVTKRLWHPARWRDCPAGLSCPRLLPVRRRQLQSHYSRLSAGDR